MSHYTNTCVYLHPKHARLIKRAAKRADVSVSELIREAAVKAAERILTREAREATKKPTTKKAA